VHFRLNPCRAAPEQRKALAALENMARICGLEASPIHLVETPAFQVNAAPFA
jgi:hypothetical protein